ncbi:MAG: hypothetical protein WC511_01840 [Candidatus Pacearchaeota archaeon]
MSNFLDTHPDYKNYSEEEVIKSVPSSVLIAITPDVANYYDSRIRMGLVYQLYGHSLDDSADQQQIPCLLPSHGTTDRHPSSRFYSSDRNTGEKRHAVFCFKCQRTITPFWLLYARESQRNLKFRDIFLFISKVFKVAFPRQILYSFDPLLYYTMENTEVAQKVQKYLRAEVLLQLKLSGDASYLPELKRLIVEG